MCILADLRTFGNEKVAERLTLDQWGGVWWFWPVPAVLLYAYSFASLLCS